MVLEWEGMVIDDFIAVDDLLWLIKACCWFPFIAPPFIDLIMLAIISLVTGSGSGKGATC